MRGRWLLVIAGVILAALAVTCWQVFFDVHPEGRKYEARSQQDLFLHACKSYRNSQESGNYPEKLFKLVAPTDGRKSLIDGGLSALLDPWGKPYCYAVADTAAGQELYVWCALEQDGKLRGFGTRVTADGKTRRFTITDD